LGKPTGFIEIHRKKHPTRPVEERIHDWREVYLPYPQPVLEGQAARCMDCGIPFCHQGCPLGNLIPDWNDLIYRDRWRQAIDRLHATNNFPEFTGRLCPAPCEGSCVLGINDDPVTIKSIEVSIIERAFDEGWVTARPPAARTGKGVAVVGSGPAGLAAADQLNRAGHTVTVFERADRIGGQLRYVRRQFDAVVLAGGATAARDLKVPGRELAGVHYAMEYLPLQNRRNQGDAIPDDRFITAKDKHVIIIGGGDTGADCLGTAHRQGARSVHQLELLTRPPDTRMETNPWPLWPNIFRVSSAHEEGGERLYAVSTERFSGDDQGRVKQLHAVTVEIASRNGKLEITPVPGSNFALDADLVLLAMGFLGPERGGMLDALGVKITERGNVWRDAAWMTSVPGVFTAGDMQRGQSLIVWAIAEGRSAARGVDTFLMGSSALPAPLQ
jgi:glutamate synthase (NADPH/NADH) small chain